MTRGISNYRRWQLPSLFIALLLCLAPAQAGKLLKWVDDQGQVRYGDRIPPQYAKQQQDTLNEQGVVVKTRAAAKTREQLAEEQRLAAIAAEKQRLIDEAAAHDRVLLDTFTTENDLIKTRDGKIDAIEGAIRLTKARTEKTKQRLLGLTQRAANMERMGRPVPDPLQKEILDARSQIKYNNTYIENRLQEQQAFRRKFEADLKRFRELKKIQAENEQLVNRESASLPPHQ